MFFADGCIFVSSLLFATSRPSGKPIGQYQTVIAPSLKCGEGFHVSTVYVGQNLFETTPSQVTVDSVS